MPHCINTYCIHRKDLDHISFLATTTVLCITERVFSSLSYTGPQAIRVLVATLAFPEAGTIQM